MSSRAARCDLEKSSYSALRRPLAQRRRPLALALALRRARADGGGARAPPHREPAAAGVAHPGRTHSRLTGVKLFTCAAHRLPGGSAAAALTASAALAASTQNGSPSSAKPRSDRPSPTRHTTSALCGSAPAQRAARHDSGSASATSVLTLSRRSAASSWKAVSRRSDSPLTPHKTALGGPPRPRRHRQSRGASRCRRPRGARLQTRAASKPRPSCSRLRIRGRRARRQAALGAIERRARLGAGAPGKSRRQARRAGAGGAAARRGRSQRRRARPKSTRASSAPAAGGWRLDECARGPAQRATLAPSASERETRRADLAARARESVLGAVAVITRGRG